MQFLQFFFRQRQFYCCSRAHHAPEYDGQCPSFTERVHLIRTATGKRSARSASDPALSAHPPSPLSTRRQHAARPARANQAHVETGTAAHRRDIR